MARSGERPDGGKTGSESLARVIRERREEVGLSRQELADATGIPYPTIAQIETAYRGVSPGRLGVIARVLGLDPKELYDVLASEPPAGSTAAGESGPAAAPAKDRGRRVGAAGVDAGGGALRGMGWHANPRFSTRPAPVAPAGRPSQDPTDRLPMSAKPAQVIDRVVDLLTSLPADQRIEALGKVQRRVLERLVEDRLADDA